MTPADIRKMKLQGLQYLDNQGYLPKKANLNNHYASENFHYMGPSSLNSNSKEERLLAPRDDDAFGKF
jgi:hypothetical protein